MSGIGDGGTLPGVGVLSSGASDAQLLGRGADGVAGLYDRYAVAVLRLAVRVLGDRDEADEAVHDTFVLAWRKHRTVTLANGSALPWLLSTVRLEALASRRRAIRRAARQVRFDPEMHDGAVDLAEESSVEDLLPGSSPADRAVLQAVLVDGLSYAAAAALLGVPVTTVGKRHDGSATFGSFFTSAAGAIRR